MIPTSLATASSNVTDATAGAATGAKSQIAGNYADFLRLLMTQLKNQDPTAPLDTNQFTQQLVQFSSVEQQLNTNANLTKLISLQEGNQVLQASALVGKTVDVTSDHLALQGGRGAIKFGASGNGVAEIAVFGPTGAKLRDAQVTTTPGSNGWSWDGRDNNGKQLADGAYAVAVTADGAGVPVTVTGTATAVDSGTSGMTLRIGSLSVPLTAVRSVN